MKWLFTLGMLSNRTLGLDSAKQFVGLSQRAPSTNSPKTYTPTEKTKKNFELWVVNLN